MSNTNEDAVNSPTHYTAGGIETIDYMRAKATREEFVGHLRLTCIKYLSRGPYKGSALQDYRKAQVYLGWLVEEMARNQQGTEHGQEMDLV